MVEDMAKCLEFLLIRRASGVLFYIGWDLLARCDACKASRSIVPFSE